MQKDWMATLLSHITGFELGNIDECGFVIYQIYMIVDIGLATWGIVYFL